MRRRKGFDEMNRGTFPKPKCATSGVHLPLRGPVVHSSFIGRLLVVHCGSLWFIVVHCGSLWFIVVHCGSLSLWFLSSFLFLSLPRLFLAVPSLSLPLFSFLFSEIARVLNRSESIFLLQQMLPRAYHQNASQGSTHYGFLFGNMHFPTRKLIFP